MDECTTSVCRQQEEQYKQYEPIDHFPRDVTYTQKFDYYSADHTWGGNHALLTYYVQWGKPNQRTAMHVKPALFVEQREHFHLPFVASPYNLPSWRYSLLEITLSFQNAQSVPLLVSRPLYK